MAKHNDVEKAFRFAVACGTATSFSEYRSDFIEEIYSKLVIEKEIMEIKDLLKDLLIMD